MTEADKERERRRKLLLEKLKKREKEASTKAGSAPPPKGALQPTAKPSAPVSRDRPSSASAPPAGNTEILSYKQRLERAAKQQDEKKNLGIITHKARAPVVEKKEWQKKLEAQKARQQLPKGSVAVDRKSKSPGVISANERTALTAKKPLGKDAAKSNLAKKPEPDGRRSSITKGKPLDKGKPGELIKRKRSPSPISWRGKNASAITTKKPSRPKHGRSKYDDDDDDDDSWIVDDDDEEDSGRGRQSSYSRKYIHHHDQLYFRHIVLTH